VIQYAEFGADIGEALDFGHFRNQGHPSLVIFKIAVIGHSRKRPPYDQSPFSYENRLVTMAGRSDQEGPGLCGWSN
jgi:hypothetical protein